MGLDLVPAKSLAHAFILAALLGSGDSFGIEDDLPDAIVTQQRVRFNDDPGLDTDFFFSSGVSAEAVVSAFRQAIGQPELKNARVLGFLADERDAEEVRRSVHPFAEADLHLFRWQEPSESPPPDDHAFRAPKGPERFIASASKPLSRIELLKQFQELEAKLPASELNALTETGDQLIRSEFSHSARRWILIGTRGTMAGLGTAITLTLSNVPGIISLPLIAATFGASTFVTIKSDWLARFTAKTTPLERWFTTFARSFSKPRNSALPEGVAKMDHSGFIAQHLKWGAVEFSAIEFIKLTGYSAYLASGIAETPEAFHLGSGLIDALELTGDTVLTQGVYENLIQREFWKRNLPYHALIAYYTDLIARESDPAAIAGYRRIVESCLYRGIRERTIRAVWLTLGTASWSLASALKVLPDKTYAKLASYSLLGAAGALKSYYFVRQVFERRILHSPDRAFLSELGHTILSRLQEACTSLFVSVEKTRRRISAKITVIGNRLQPRGRASSSR